MPSVVRRFVDAAPAPPGTSVREDTISVGLGAWMVVGLYVDGWAHNTVRGLETFFTPWHGLLYSGFAAGAAWIGLLAWRRRAGRTWWSALPPGYHAAAVGVALFGLGGLGDMAWHIAFGVEVGLDALLSPTHLVLLTGATLMLTAALRANWSRPPSPGRCSLRLDLPAILSLMLVTALAGFFLMYTSVFLRPAAAQPFVQLFEGSAGHGSDEGGAAAGLADYLVTTALLVLPVLLAARHGRRPIGTIVILVAGVAWATIAVGDFTDYGVAAALAVTAAAGAAEGGHPDRPLRSRQVRALGGSRRDGSGAAVARSATRRSCHHRLAMAGRVMVGRGRPDGAGRRRARRSS